MLNPLDDYPIHQTSAPVAHPVSASRNHFDRYFFNGYDPDGSLFFGVALGLYPNREVIDAAFSVLVDGEQRSLNVSGRAPLDRGHTTVGPLRVEVIEPLRRLRVVVDASDLGLAADLTFTARSIACAEPHFMLHHGTSVVFDYTRLTQLGAWEGRIEVDGEILELDPTRHRGVRDRSWGVRPVGEQPEPSSPSSTKARPLRSIPEAWSRPWPTSGTTSSGCRGPGGLARPASNWCRGAPLPARSPSSRS